MNVYLDNAATTALDPKVSEAMKQVMDEVYGNPSSVHAFGRKARAKIENARKKIAETFNVSPGEIFFTSGGTEADNMAIWQTVMDLRIEHVITSRIEHHAVLHTVEELARRGIVTIDYLPVDEKGYVQTNKLESLLKDKEKCLVTLMHANNEIGNLIDLKQVSDVCKKYHAVFHSDTVQTIGHYKVDLKETPVDIISCSAHKFHGPKGAGFIYINSDILVNPLIYGGAQERNMRGGTENIYGIVGLQTALELACEDIGNHEKYVLGLKNHMIARLENEILGIEFNGDPKGKSLYTVLNICLPKTDKAEMLLYLLDIKGIACSAGSACSSGANAGSHVLHEIGSDMERPSLRFSFSRMTSKEEVDYACDELVNIFNDK